MFYLVHILGPADNLWAAYRYVFLVHILGPAGGLWEGLEVRPVPCNVSVRAGAAAAPGEDAAGRGEVLHLSHHLPGQEGPGRSQAQPTSGGSPTVR